MIKKMLQNKMLYIFSLGIRKLQCILLKVCLILGVQIYPNTSFEELLEPSDGKVMFLNNFNIFPLLLQWLLLYFQIKNELPQFDSFAWYRTNKVFMGWTNIELT